MDFVVRYLCRRSRPAVAAVLLFVVAPVATAQVEEIDDAAATGDNEVVIGTRVVAPFVIAAEDGTYEGLTIYLWEQIASEMGIEFRYEETDIQGMLDGVAEGRYFASASALTTTAQRERHVDFTHPYHVSGLGIAVSHKPAGIWAAIRAIFSVEFLWVVVLLLGLLLFWGALVWIFERKKNSEEFGGTTVEGVGSGLWWAAVTMTTVGYGDKSPRTLGGRMIGFVWMFGGIVVISFFTAAIASSLTVTQLDSRVSGPADLPYVRVGVVAGSATQELFAADNISARSYADIDEGLRGVEADEIDAFVHDAPLLAYAVQEAFRNRVRMLPVTFNDQYYGIVLPLDSEHRNQINQLTLQIINEDEWQQLLRRYLGE